MFSHAAHCFLPPLIRAVREGGTVARGSIWRGHVRHVWRCSDVTACYFSRAAIAQSTWHQHHQRRLQGHHRHYHLPFTIARMDKMGFLQVHKYPAPTTVSLWAFPNTTVKECHVRLYSSKPTSVPSSSTDENQNKTKTSSSKGEEGTASAEAAGQISKDDKSEEKLSIVQKFKLMYKQYWYVLIPVHIATSIVWYGSFFIAAKRGGRHSYIHGMCVGYKGLLSRRARWESSGVDIIPLMEKLGAGEKILSHLRSSNAGYYAIAYAMYKIATPARYTVTVGGTTISINYLKKHGYIKPIPSSEQLKEMYEVVRMRVRAWRKMVFRRKYESSVLTRLYRPV